MTESEADEQDLAARLDEQREIVRRHRDKQVELSERQAAVLARSAVVHDDVARVHNTLPERVLKVTPAEAREHADLDRARSAEETRHAAAARERRAEAEAEPDP